MRKIKQGDQVVVIAGKDKGERGTVLRVVQRRRGLGVVVEGVNQVRKHQKPNPQVGQPGGIIDQEKPLDVSNVMLVNPATGGGDRVGFKLLEDGRKVRYFKSNGETVDA